jgi:hypothetical protein
VTWRVDDAFGPGTPEAPNRRQCLKELDIIRAHGCDRRKDPFWRRIGLQIVEFRELPDWHDLVESCGRFSDAALGRGQEVADQDEDDTERAGDPAPKRWPDPRPNPLDGAREDRRNGENEPGIEEDRSEHTSVYWDSGRPSRRSSPLTGATTG